MEILKLREARDKAGLDQHQVGKLIQRHATEISTYENGRAVPTVEDICRLETALGVRLDWDESEDNDQRREFIQNMNCLCKRFPVVSVLTLAMKSVKEPVPGELLSKYCTIYKRMDGEGDVQVNLVNPPGGPPLYPTGQEIN